MKKRWLAIYPKESKKKLKGKRTSLVHLFNKYLLDIYYFVKVHKCFRKVLKVNGGLKKK